MRAALPLLLLLSTACATILRSNQRDLMVYAPAETKVMYGGSELPVVSRTDGKLVAKVPHSASAVTLQTPAQEAQAPLHRSVGAGWVVADVLFGFWPVIVDVITGAWNNFDDVDGSTARWEARGNTLPQIKTSARSAAAMVQPAAALAIAPVVSSGKLAVLDFRNSARDLGSDNVRYFADVVRGASLKTAPGLDVMTRENLLVLLQASGKDAASCEGECEVDTGRRIGADAVISGEVLKVGTRYKISLKLHDTHEGRLLSTGVASGKTVDELDEALQTAASELLARPR
jgi:TolB-like protein